MRVMKHTDRGLILPVEVKVAGKYRVRVYRPDGRCRHDTGWFENLVTDAGLNTMGSGGYLNACQVGSGTTAPAVTDTSLVSFVAGTTALGPDGTVNGAQGAAPYYGFTIRQWRFGAGDAAGNLSEVGVGTAATGGTLFSRALITDGAGSPTTITVLADEFLDVTYQIQSVVPTTDSTFNVTDSGPAGTVHGVTLRAANATTGFWADFGQAVILTDGAGSTATQARAYDGTIGTVAGAPSGNPAGQFSVANTAYANNSLEKLGTLSYGLDGGNLAAGIKSLAFPFERGGGFWQAELDPVINKTNTDTLSLDVKTSWTRTTAL